VSRNEKDYSDYIQHSSNISNFLSLVYGFVFTAITILLTQLSAPSSLQSQIILFFLTVLFNVYRYLLDWNLTMTTHYCEMPPLRREITIFNRVLFISGNLLGSAIVLMFFLWNLVYLALVSGVVYLLRVALSYVFIIRPFQKHRRKLSS